MRGYHPIFGNKPAVRRVFAAYYASIIAVLIMGRLYSVGQKHLEAGRLT
jgi:hypothetical protein